MLQQKRKNCIIFEYFKKTCSFLYATCLTPSVKTVARDTPQNISLECPVQLFRRDVCDGVAQVLLCSIQHQNVQLAKLLDH